MEIKERIVEGARKMFMSEGVRRVTMDQIAKRLGVSKRTIYEHFTDKTQLLEATIDESTKLHDEYLKDVFTTSNDVIELVVAGLKFGVASLNEINPIYMEDLQLYYPKVYGCSINQRRQELTSGFEGLLTRGIKEGFFRSNINVKLVAKIFMEQINAMNNREMFPVNEYPTSELFEALLLNFTRGISTLEGVKKLDCLLEANT
ncbi:MAG TPA: TetR/AcrR family transcriptional regulator [Marinilabiliaceae bacterium]|nr:TetR/AcrR family transcriptional regulator [Marinilabiliaceae bacterium]